MVDLDANQVQCGAGVGRDGLRSRAGAERGLPGQAGVVGDDGDHHTKIALPPEVEVLAPGPAYATASIPTNDDSLVLWVKFGGTAFLLTGDMEKKIEAQLVAEGLLRHADVLKVGHHGSKTSSTGEFLDQVHPALAVMSDGYGNLYGHPHPVTLASLRDRHVLAFRTDLDGAVTFVTDGTRVWRE